MPWIPDSDAPTYRFRPSGALEFQDRRGRYRLVQGVSVAGYFDFWDDYEQLQKLMGDAPQDSTVEGLYLECPEFQRLADRLMWASGIDLEWIAPSMLTWLLFPHQVGNTLIEGALALLNRPAERKYPPLPGGGAVDTHTKLMTAIVSAAGGDFAKAMELAEKLSTREFFAISEELSWQHADSDKKGKAWAIQRIEEMKARGQTSVLNPAEIAAFKSKGA